MTAQRRARRWAYIGAIWFVVIAAWLWLLLWSPWDPVVAAVALVFALAYVGALAAFAAWRDRRNKHVDSS